MISPQLVRTDLNLLVVLQILLEERNVTRSAERLNVSQPALSKTLQKLREAFDDELFTRTAHGLIPTPKAETLAKSLPGALGELDKLLVRDEFEPASYEGIFRLLIPPMYAEVLLPRLMEELAIEAPGVSLLTGDVTVDFQDRLKRAEIDFAVSAVSDTDRDVHAEPLRVIKGMCYMRKGHPLEDKKISLKQFLAYPHVRLYLPGPSRENMSLVDEVLGERGMHRKVMLETTQFAPAIGVLARTDCLLIANAGFDEKGELPEEVIGQPLPEELVRLFEGHSGGTRVRAALLRHTRTSNSAAHQWMRKLIVKHLSEPETGGRPR